MNDDLSRARQLRVGLIADTHMPGTIKELWPEVHEGFSNVDCILHAGDLHVPEVIDQLDELAPTFVCRGNGDRGVDHHKLKEHWVGSLAGVQVGMIHKFPTPQRASPELLEQKVAGFFPGADPEIVIYGHTHLAEVHRVQSRLYINPGSPTLPNNQSTRRGTVGFLTISTRAITVELFQIGEPGLILTTESNMDRQGTR